MGALIPPIPLLLVILFSLFIGIYIIGHFLLSFWEDNIQNDFERLFRKLVVGLIICTVVYSTYKTNFNTIFVTIWIISIIYFYWNKSQITTFSYKNFIRIEWIPISISFSILLFFFFFFFFRNVTFNFYPREEFLDEPFYAGIADYFNIFGIETTSLNTIDTLYQSPVFYNHFNQWFTALISFIFDIPSLVIYKYITFPILYTIAYVGVYSLSQRFFKRNILLHYIISLLFFFLSGTGILINNIINQPNYGIFWDACITLKQHSKLIIGVIFIILAILNSKDKLTEKTIYPLLILSVLYISFMPAILGAIVIYILYSYIIKDKVSKIFILFLVVIISVILFYFINIIIHPYPFDSYTIFDLFQDYRKTNLFKLKTYIVTSYGYFTAFVISSVIYSLLIFTNKSRFNFINKTNRSYIVLMLGAIISGFSLLLLLKHTYDGHQFFSNPILVIYIIGLFSIICWTVNKISIINIVILIVILFNAVHNINTYFIHQKDFNRRLIISYEYQNQIIKEFKGKQFTSAYVRNPINITKGQLMFNNLINIPFPQMRSITTSYFPIPLSIFDTQNFSNLAQKDAYFKSSTNTPFFNYYNTHKAVSSIDSVKYQFLKQFKIDYLIVEKNNTWYNKWQEKLQIDKIIGDKEDQFLLLKLRW